MNYVVMIAISLAFGILAMPQLNSSNELNRELPMVTESSSPSKVHLDIDHSSKGDVTAECDKNPDTTILDADKDRSRSKIVYHNCELTYQTPK